MKLLACLLLFSLAAGAQQPVAAAPPTSAAQPKRIDSLHELSTLLEGLSRRVSRSLVQIFSTGYALSEEGDSGTNAAVVTRQRATGSGVILSADGYIVTNAHVVSNARRVRVRQASEGPSRATMQPSGNILDARVVGVDRETDLAVLKIEKTGLPHLNLGDSDSLRQGQLVMGVRQSARTGKFGQHGRGEFGGPSDQAG